MKSSSSTESSKEKVAKFGDFFSTAITKLKRNSFKLINLTLRISKYFQKYTNSRFHFKYVSVVFVRNQLKVLKRGKATGLDQLPPGLLKDATC